MRRRVLVVLLVTAWAAACVWRGYATILAVHLDVLTQTAAKLCAITEAGKGPTVEGMAEYVYPAKRARDFLRQFSTYGERPSYWKFSALVDQYEAMVRRADTLRAQGTEWRQEAARLTADQEALRRLAAEIRADLKKGS